MVAESQSSTHGISKCLAIGCDKTLWPGTCFCVEHWTKVPRHLKAEIEQATQNHDREAWISATTRAQAAVCRAQDEDGELDGMVLIVGDTFPVKDKLKKLGGKWDPDAKGWRVPKSQKMAAEALVNNAHLFTDEE